MSKITGKEHPLVSIFSQEFDFHIPEYRRPYAWTTDESGVLFDNLYYAVFRDASMADDSTATNFDQIFETYSPSDIRKVL